jgi:hypothetical protein
VALRKETVVEVAAVTVYVPLYPVGVMPVITTFEPMAGKTLIAFAHVTVTVVPLPEAPLVGKEINGANTPKLTVKTCEANEEL